MKNQGVCKHKKPRKLLDQVSDIMRLKHYAYRTERTYTGWIKRFILFYDKKHPGEIYKVGQHKPISVDLRIIAASQFDLREAVDKGNFREDLFYRLNVLPISIPPLREREGDILILARHTLKRCALALRKEGIGFSSESERTLTRYSWPGNVRELENVVERAVNLTNGPVIEPAHFGSLPLSRPGVASKNLTGSRLEETEKEIIKRTLEETRYNISRASFILGISRTTLYKRLKKYRISLPGKDV